MLHRLLALINLRQNKQSLLISRLLISDRTLLAQNQLRVRTLHIIHYVFFIWTTKNLIFQLLCLANPCVSLLSYFLNFSFSQMGVNSTSSENFLRPKIEIEFFNNFFVQY